ncbi:hypothetical protein Cni_G12959 [Canna indica]|uniref:Uncharacterized protein n=1 Tax=Canna indica TaxID=4628 RepID=A0AAQ3KBP4_9LILI|nr:hypothetical protein Cni_G12959 [Canna indica]
MKLVFALRLWFKSIGHHGVIGHVAACPLGGGVLTFVREAEACHDRLCFLAHLPPTRAQFAAAGLGKKRKGVAGATEGGGGTAAWHVPGAVAGAGLRLHVAAVVGAAVRGGGGGGGEGGDDEEAEPEDGAGAGGGDRKRGGQGEGVGREVEEQEGAVGEE